MTTKRNVPKYKLYVGYVQEVPEGVKYSLVPSHLLYMLIYSDVQPEPKENFAELDEEANFKDMSEEEKIWLMKSKMQVNVAYMNDHKEEYIDGFDAWLDAFEKELKAERARQNKKRNKTKGAQDVAKDSSAAESEENAE